MITRETAYIEFSLREWFQSDEMKVSLNSKHLLEMSWKWHGILLTLQSKWRAWYDTDLFGCYALQRGKSEYEITASNDELTSAETKERWDISTKMWDLWLSCLSSASAKSWHRAKTALGQTQYIDGTVGEASRELHDVLGCQHNRTGSMR